MPMPTVVTRLRSAPVEPVAFGLLVLAALTPLVTLRHFVSIDGPSHLEGAQVLLHHAQPLLSRYYRIDLFPTPNLTGELLLAAALKVAGATVAEKLVVAAYVVLFLLAFRYAVRSVRREAVALTYLGFAFVYQRLLFYGFYNYCYGVALALLVIGYVLRHPPPWSRRTTVVAAGLLLLTYFAHLLPLLIAALFVVIATVDDLARRRRAGLDLDPVRRVLPQSLALLPVTALGTVSLLRPGPARMVPTWSSSPLGRAVDLLSLRVGLQVFGRGEAVAAVVLALILLTATVLAWRGRTGPPGVAAVCAAAVGLTGLLFVATPNSAGADYGFLPQRVALFPVFFLVLWLAATLRVRWVGTAVAVGAVVVAAGLVVARTPWLRHYDHRIDEVASVSRVVPPGSTLVAVRLSLDAPPHSPWRRTTDPLRHIASLVAALTDGVDLGHYEAQLAYFPTQFRTEYLFATRTGRPFVLQDRVPPQATLFDRLQPPSYQPEYVLLIGARDATTRTLRTKPVKHLLSVLGGRYRLIYVTRPTGLVRVYQRLQP